MDGRRAAFGMEPSRLTPTERAVSVLVGYSAGAVVVLPFDRVKSLMQVDAASRRLGALHLARRIVAADGARGLYQGGAAHMLIAPYAILYYLIYDAILTRGRAASATPTAPGGHHLVPLAAALVARTAEVRRRHRDAARRRPPPNHAIHSFTRAGRHL